MYLCYRKRIKQKCKIYSSHWQVQLHMPERISFTIQPSPNSTFWELGLYVLILKPITKLYRRIESIDRKCECVPPCHAHNLWMLVVPSLQPASVLTHMHMLLLHITKINKQIVNFKQKKKKRKLRKNKSGKSIEDSHQI